jgi:hypothetical protein
MPVRAARVFLRARDWFSQVAKNCNSFAKLLEGYFAFLPKKNKDGNLIWQTAADPYVLPIINWNRRIQKLKFSIILEMYYNYIDCLFWFC